MAGELKKPIMDYLAATQSPTIQRTLNGDTRLAIARFFQHLSRAGDVSAEDMRAKWEEICQISPAINPAINRNLERMFATAEKTETAAQVITPQVQERKPVIRRDPLQERANKKEMERRERNVERIDAVYERFLESGNTSGSLIMSTGKDMENVDNIKKMIRENSHGGNLKSKIDAMKFESGSLQGMLSEAARKMDQPKPKSFLQRAVAVLQDIFKKEKPAPEEGTKRKLR